MNKIHKHKAFFTFLLLSIFGIIFLIDSQSVNAAPPDVTGFGTVSLAAGSNWKYSDDNAMPPNDGGGNAWYQSAFDDSAWNSGDAPLGFGDLGGLGSTQVAIETAINSNRTTYYFRIDFTVTGGPFDSAALHVLAEDGFVAYLDGTEIARNNMPAGDPNYSTNATINVDSDEESQYFGFDITPIANDNHVLAVEVHQASGGGGDLGFDAMIAQANTANFGTCYAVGDQENTSSTDDYMVQINRGTGLVTGIGAVMNTSTSSPTENIEAIAMRPGTTILYASDADTLGTINTATGQFTAIGAYGSADGSLGNITINDVDGLTFSPDTGQLWGIQRQTGSNNDLLIEIDPATGAIVQDRFGANVDYLPIQLSPSDGFDDYDDIAIAPDANATMYAVANNGSGNTEDMLVEIHYKDAATAPFPSEVSITEIGEFGIGDVEGISMTPDGDLYATTGRHSADLSFQDKMFRVDLATGAATEVTDLAIDSLEKHEAGDGEAEYTDFEASACLVSADSPTAINLAGLGVSAGGSNGWLYTIAFTMMAPLTALCYFAERRLAPHRLPA